MTAQTSSTFLFSRAAVTGVFVAVLVVVMTLFLGADWEIAWGPLVVNALILLAWLVSALGFGLIAVGVMRLKCTAALRIVIALAMGLGIVGLVTLALGCCGALNRVSAIGVMVVGIVGASISVLRKPTAWRWAWMRSQLNLPGRFHWLWIALAPILAISIVSALLPPGLLWGDEPNGYDVTEYHLQVPREWFEAQKIVPLHHNVFSYFPFNVEMHYLLAMHLLGGPWKGMYLAQLMHVSFVGLTVVAVWALLAERYPRGAIIAGIFAGATPWLSLLAPVAYNEGGLLLFGTLAIGLAMRALGELKPGKWMILAGAMAGFACGSKLTAVPMIVIPLPIIIAFGRFLFPPLPPGEGRGEGVLNRGKRSIAEGPLTLTLSRRERGSEATRLIGTFWIAAVITFSPWLIRDALWTHNPLFPEATSLFGKAHWTDVQVERWQRANHLPREDQQNLPARFHAGWSQILFDARFGYLLLPLAGFALLLRRDRTSLALGTLLLFQVIFWLFFTHLQSRFFVLSIPICALLIGGAEIRGWELLSTTLALIVAVFGVFFTSSKIASLEQRLAQYQLRLFSLTGLPTLRGFSRLPETDDGRVVELVGDAQAFLYDVPMKRLYYRTVFDVDAQAGETAEQAWRKGWPQGSDVNVIINDSELERFHRTYWSIPEP